MGSEINLEIWLRSCKEEIIEPLSGTVSGTVPAWLNGALIRNGAGLYEIGDSSFKHLFDGSAMLHKFTIKEGDITYQCRFIQSETYKKNKKANRIVVSEFGTNAVPDPCLTIFQRAATTFTTKSSDNANISLYPFGDEIYAVGELPWIHRINKDDLTVENRVNLGEKFAIVNNTAHPHVLPNGTVYNLALSIVKSKPCHHIICFPAKPSNCEKDYSMFNNARIVATIPSRWPLHPCYMHSFGITENYFIIVEQPLSISVPKVIRNKLSNQPVASCLQWYDNELVKFNVISRKTGKLAHKFYAKAFCYFHIINQYEKSDHIILDVCSYKDASIVNCVYIDAMKSNANDPNYADKFKSQPVRFALPLTTMYQANHNCNLVTLTDTKAQAYLQTNGNILLKPEILCDIMCELPRIHWENFLGKEYQFFYATGAELNPATLGMIIKVDTRSKTTLIWHEKDCYLSEPVFVPKPNPQTEDDGVVLASLLRGSPDVNKTGLIILDARTFTEIARAEFETPTPVPRCFHGWFLFEK